MTAAFTRVATKLLYGARTTSPLFTDSLSGPPHSVVHSQHEESADERREH
jgi:hypothetical protein